MAEKVGRRRGDEDEEGENEGGDGTVGDAKAEGLWEPPRGGSRAAGWPCEAEPRSSQEQMSRFVCPSIM